MHLLAYEEDMMEIKNQIKMSMYSSSENVSIARLSAATFSAQAELTLSDIEEKDVINVVTGERIGFVSSLRIDTNSGQIIAITVQPSMKFVSFFSKDEASVVVPWNQILKIGEDVIIVNVAQQLNEF